MKTDTCVATHIALVLFLLMGSSYAQVPGHPVRSENMATTEAHLDLSVPESPAFAVLGLTPQTVIRPSSPVELATSVLTGIDQNGTLQSGFAIDTGPYLLLYGSRVTINNYRNSYVRRLLARTQASLATARAGSTSDKSIRAAFGLRITLWDLGDPRLDELLTECFNSRLTFPDLPPGQTLPERERALAAHESVIKKKAEECRQAARKRNWNRSSWAIGAAPTMISQSGRTDTMKWDGVSLWTSLAYGFEKVPKLQENSQFILHFRYRTREHLPVATPSSPFLEQNSVLVGGRLRMGSPSFIMALEGAFIHADPEGRPKDDYYRVSVEADLHLKQDLWFEISVGGETNRRDGNNQAFIFPMLKWAFPKEPSLGTIPSL